MCYIILSGSVIIIYHNKCCKNILIIVCILFCLIQSVPETGSASENKKKVDIDTGSSEVALFIIY